MRMTSRFAALAIGTVLTATLVACGTTYPTQPVGTSYPTTTYPTTSTPPAASPAYAEYGRITNIEYLQGTAATTGGVNTTNAVIGGVIGAVVGNAIGDKANDGKNRTGATVLGGAAGAAVGSQVGKTAGSAATDASYRVTVQTDAGAMRSFQLSGTGNLRIGDRVRVENGVITRS